MTNGENGEKRMGLEGLTSSCYLGAGGARVFLGRSWRGVSNGGKGGRRRKKKKEELRKKKKKKKKKICKI